MTGGMPAARRHPRLTPCRRANEHLTFCDMHRRQAQNRALPASERALHRLAAQAHETSVVHHLRNRTVRDRTVRRRR